MSLDQILSACHWKSHNTFTQFYLKDVAWSDTELYHLGPIVTAQQIRDYLVPLWVVYNVYSVQCLRGATSFLLVTSFLSCTFFSQHAVLNRKGRCGELTHLCPSSRTQVQGLKRGGGGEQTGLGGRFSKTPIL